MGKPWCTLKQDCMGRTSTDIYLASVAYERISNFCKNVVFMFMLYTLPYHPIGVFFVDINFQNVGETWSI